MSSPKAEPLSAFVSFPSPYTQSLLVQALVSTLPSLALSLAQPPEDQPPALQWADYDLMSFDIPHKNPSKYLISSYIYRKALIRKHQLHNTITAYLAKCSHRQIPSILSPLPETYEGETPLGGGAPKGWIVDIQFADELDELLMDDLYELDEGMRANEEKAEGEKRWWILKPGFADRAQGIRMFSSEEELRFIFAEFEPPSSDEEDDEGEDGDDESEDGEEVPPGGMDGMIDMLAKKAVELGFNGEDEDDEEDGDEDEGTGVMTSQLRHFVIQEYLPRPLLFDIAQIPGEPPAPLEGNKFHLRAYVLVTGAYKVYLANTMLALFSGEPYGPPKTTEDGDLDLRPHLTNTCLQTDAYGAPAPPADLVKLFWELEGLTALSSSTSPSPSGSYAYDSHGSVTKEWLESTFAKVGEVVSETVKAGAECGSFGLQFMPNAFEIFGVDLILSFPPVSPANALPIPVVTLLEFNASPDFHQSGDRLRPQLLDMFKGVIKHSIFPFFGVETTDKEEVSKENPMKVGEEKWGWRLVGEGEVRGSEW
ncbi:hypothetical protein I350_00095 [Cryptococcus amylolentus CBS 6273]|uniref:Cytoplasmic protein n=1 Tax=Cryptococcus amylolentus CBS 6273 TaxID=1296118 RepID=A0A1E3KE06_9TREE|nr:hypothetical protein I350_00095 [Cryptococcus amylolentus CBS 6273]